jgi:hemerythrin-like metal-binding protein
MPLWTHSLRTGDADLDAQHRDLLGLLEAAVAAAGRRDAAGAQALLAAFQAACEGHFAVEQRAMASLVGPSLRASAVRAHLDSHDEFLADLARLRGELSARGLTPMVHLWLSSRLVEWLRFHTRTMDAGLAEAGLLDASR